MTLDVLLRLSLSVNPGQGSESDHVLSLTLGGMVMLNTKSSSDSACSSEKKWLHTGGGV